MPDINKYPPGFDHRHQPYQPIPRYPQETLEDIENLTSEEDSCDILLCLADIREAHPTATHIYVEKESRGEDYSCKATIQHRTSRPNPNYVAEKKAYDEGVAAAARVRAEWVSNCQRWNAELESEKDTADYKVYLGLKARFEGGR
jgi:hypothetical protein